jgi:hypothetical protein
MRIARVLFLVAAVALATALVPSAAPASTGACHSAMRQRPVGQHVVRVIVGGPGPSYLNLPTAGCWRLSLQWSGRSDELDLDYQRRR